MNTKRYFFGLFFKPPGAAKFFATFTLLILLGNGDEVLAQAPPDWFRRGGEHFPMSDPKTTPPSSQAKPGEAKPVLTEPQPSVVQEGTPLVAPKVPQNEIGVAADFMLGQGNVSVPIGYSLDKSSPSSSVKPQAASAERSSIYYGGTISYSFGQAWFIDVSSIQGSSSGNVSFPAFNPAGDGKDFKTKFTIDDQWYQAYIRYAFPSLRGKPFSAYLRGGISYVTADLRVDSTGNGAGRYTQDDTTTDLLGNLGFGVSYRLYTSPNRKLRLAVSGEGEAFYGMRNQESLERLTETDLAFKKARIDNTLYGGIGRATLRLDYLLGQSRALRAFVEGGAQARYTLISYPNSSDPNPSELLWGPYAKIGMRYNF